MVESKFFDVFISFVATVCKGHNGLRTGLELLWLQLFADPRLLVW